MNTIEEKIGYLIAKVEEQAADQKKLTERFDSLERKVEDKFRTAEVAIRIFKFIGLAILAILTFKFGDVKTLWTTFFG